jgi:hypothetical protein
MSVTGNGFYNWTLITGPKPWSLLFFPSCDVLVFLCVWLSGLRCQLLRSYSVCIRWMTEYGALMECCWQGKVKYSEQKLSQCKFSLPVPYGLASDYLSHGMVFGGCDWICVAQSENQQQAVVKTRVPYKMAVVLSSICHQFLLDVGSTARHHKHLCGERLATNCLSHGMSHYILLFYDHVANCWGDKELMSMTYGGTIPLSPCCVVYICISFWFLMLFLLASPFRFWWENLPLHISGYSFHRESFHCSAHLLQPLRDTGIIF